MAGRVCVVGSANLDLVARVARLPSPGETVLGSSYMEHPGGKGLNQAVAAARLGAAVTFVGAVGDDEAGRRLLAVMSDDDVDAAGVSVYEGPTGRAVIGVADDGENSIIVVPGANALLGPELSPAALGALSGADVVLAQLEVPIAAIAAAFAAAPRAVKVLNPAPATTLPAAVLRSCDVVVPNEHELELLGGVGALRSSGVAAVVATEGRRGAVLYDERRSDGLRIDAFPVAAVDTTAAGDAFCGVLAARLADGADLVEALRWAAAAGALAATVAGAVPSLPRREAVAALVSGAA